MNFEKSLEITAQIGKAIASGAPQITFSAKELEQARGKYSDEKLQELEKMGFDTKIDLDEDTLYPYIPDCFPYNRYQYSL